MCRSLFGQRQQLVLAVLLGRFGCARRGRLMLSTHRKISIAYVALMLTNIFLGVHAMRLVDTISNSAFNFALAIAAFGIAAFLLFTWALDEYT